MTLRLPHTLSSDDPGDGTPTVDRVQENFDEIAKQFPVSLANASRVPQARVYNSANIATVTGVQKVLTFDSERWDTGGLHDTVTNNSRLTCVVPGLYDICGHVEWAAAAGGTYRYTAILLNGGTKIAPQVAQPSGTHNSQTTVSAQYRLVAGDYVELVAQQDSGGALNVLAAANTSPEFSMHWVSP